MTVLYEDFYVTCDEDAITINGYYIPMGSLRIPYQSIKKYREEKLNFWQEGLRIWGMGLSPYWFHFDPLRPTKTKCIILDRGEMIKSVITPADHNKVLQILQERVPLPRLEL